MKYWWAAKAAKFLLFAAFILALFGFAVMFLWNWLIPEIFGGPTVTYWQAMGLLLLSHILVRGWHGSDYWKSNRWKHRMEEKLAAMTPEEREKFKEEWRRRCGYYPGDEKKEM
jgi:positive regulator of sigma E activity